MDASQVNMDSKESTKEVTKEENESVPMETDRESKPASMAENVASGSATVAVEAMDVDPRDQSEDNSMNESVGNNLAEALDKDTYSNERVVQMVKDKRQEHLEKLLDLHFEVCFLEQLLEHRDAGTTIMDFPAWKKKPLTDPVRQFIHIHADQELIDFLTSKYPPPPPSDPSITAAPQDLHPLSSISMTSSVNNVSNVSSSVISSRLSLSHHLHVNSGSFSRNLCFSHSFNSLCNFSQSYYECEVEEFLG